MPSPSSKGCLGVLLGFLGIRLRSDELPYRLRDDFLSPAEYSFYRCLLLAVGDRAVVCPKVRLADLFFVPGANDRTHQNRINCKHVDFVLCDPVRMQPRCAIELDDRSHARSDRRDRDAFVDQVFQTAGLPLVRVPAQRTYQPAAIWSLVEVPLTEGVSRADRVAEDAGDAAPRGARSTTSTEDTEAPDCPKCGVPMVRRVARQGPQAGQAFYGCPNYPRCRETARG